MLEGFLEFQRQTLPIKAHGVSDEDGRRPLLESSPQLTLAGLVRHLTAVERTLFRIVMAGEPVDDVASPDDPKALAVPPDISLAQLIAEYEEECLAATSAVAHLELDAEASRAGLEVTLRWAFLHMIEETARHNGHADLLRESIDGTKGE